VTPPRCPSPSDLLGSQPAPSVSRMQLRVREELAPADAERKSSGVSGTRRLFCRPALGGQLGPTSEVVRTSCTTTRMARRRPQGRSADSVNKAATGGLGGVKRSLVAPAATVRLLGLGTLSSWRASILRRAAGRTTTTGKLCAACADEPSQNRQRLQMPVDGGCAAGATSDRVGRA